jgi:hypothetical protein
MVSDENETEYMGVAQDAVFGFCAFLMKQFAIRYSEVIPSFDDFQFIKPISKGAFG